MQNILVTGAAGFIGSYFVEYLINKYDKYKIISLDKLTYSGDLKNLSSVFKNPRHIFVQGDICDTNTLHKILRDFQIKTIVHFAAESHVDRSIHSPEQFIHTNVMGTFQLLEAARAYWQNELHLSENQCRFHHISTDEVYGSLTLQDPPFRERTPYAPNSPYSASKASSDHLARAYYHTYGLPVTVSNCSNNYGPRQHGEKLIPTVIRACLQNKPIPVYGNGSNRRDWLYVEDHCSAIDSILHSAKAGAHFNVGGKCELSNLELISLLCDILDSHLKREISCKSLIQFVTDRPGHDWRYAIDNSKIQAELKWHPLFTLKEGLAKTAAFYLKNFSDAGHTSHFE